jgi:Lectin C-type domain
MKTAITIFSAAMLFTVAFNTRADIIAGPVTNPANGHDYYLLSPNTWTASEAEAESLDGTLAVIKNADEQKWVFSTFGAYGGTNHDLWIGLHRNFHGGPLVWITGEKLDFADWSGGQPDNSGGIEDSVFMASANRPWGFPAGGWADFTDNGIVDGSVPNGVVELSGKAHDLSLSKAERALIGNWYEGGNIQRPCWIAGTDKILFVISNDKFSARASLSADGTLFVRDSQSGRPMMGGGMPMVESGFGRYNSMPSMANSQTGMSGEILKDKILWSNGTWWSRKPSNTNEEISSNKQTL